MTQNSDGDEPVRLGGALLRAVSSGRSSFGPNPGVGQARRDFSARWGKSPRSPRAWSVASEEFGAHSFFTGSRRVRFNYDARGTLTGFEVTLPACHGSALQLAWALSRLSLGYVIQDEPAPPGSVSLRCRVRTVAGMTLSTMETSSLKAAVLAYLGDAATPTGGEAGAEEQRSVALGS